MAPLAPWHPAPTETWGTLPPSTPDGEEGLRRGHRWARHLPSTHVRPISGRWAPAGRRASDSSRQGLGRIRWRAAGCRTHGWSLTKWSGTRPRRPRLYDRTAGETVSDGVHRSDGGEDGTRRAGARQIPLHLARSIQRRAFPEARGSRPQQRAGTRKRTPLPSHPRRHRTPLPSHPRRRTLGPVAPRSRSTRKNPRPGPALADSSGRPPGTPCHRRTHDLLRLSLPSPGTSPRRTSYAATAH